MCPKQQLEIIDIAPVGGHLLYGGIRIDPGIRRINTSLVCRDNGSCIWTNSYEQAAGEGDIRSLVWLIANEVYRRLIQPGTTCATLAEGNLDINRVLLRIRHLRYEETTFSLHEAAALAEALVAVEPSCAAGHSELASVRLYQEKLALMRHVDTEPIVRRGVDTAMRLDGNSSTSLACLAQQEYRYDWNWRAAENHLHEATRLNPFNTDALIELGNLLTLQGRFLEARHCLVNAQSLDPMSPAVALRLAYVFHNSGEVERAVPIYRELLRRNPAHLSARTGLIHGLENLREYTEAARIAHEGLRVCGPGTSRILAALACVYAMAGQRRKAFRVYDRLTAGAQESYVLAYVYSAFGENSRALRLLDAAAASKNARLANAAVTPRFAPLHNDSRFRRLIRHIGLDISK
jgi:tetratricopeptide (TPR) repeat protein